MGSSINLTAIYIANGLGALLSASVLLGNNWKSKNQKMEYKYIKYLLIIAMISCIVDPIVFTLDGRPGIIPYIFAYYGNFLFFLSNLLLGPMWICIVTIHLFGEVMKIQKRIIAVICTIGVLALIINFFYPLIFYVDENNVYQRGDVFWLFTVIEAVVLIDGMVVYFIAKMKGGIFKFFPVLQFIAPTAIGIVIQALFYGISTIWPCLAISVCGMFISLQNETVYTDPMTGLYNRQYMYMVIESIKKRKNGEIYALMFDVNAFKSINDKFGHSEGDKALIKVSDILRKTVGGLGSVIRYAGDEFVILLNTNQKEIAQGCIDAIRNNINDYNKVSGKGYKLSLSVGCSSSNMKEQTLDDLIHNIDKEMYLDKKRFYTENPDFRRRVGD